VSAWFTRPKNPLVGHRLKGVHQMNETPLETRQLPNGTTLHLVDVSRPQTADRWIVALEARIDISIDTRSLPPQYCDSPTFETVRQALGARVTYVKRTERVFVPAEDKEHLLSMFRDEFCRNVLPYLSLPTFPARYILKQYKDIEKRRAWAPPNAMASNDKT
jgi:hypothetical protein